jgi:hypothetical protein
VYAVGHVVILVAMESYVDDGKWSIFGGYREYDEVMMIHY